MLEEIIRLAASYQANHSVARSSIPYECSQQYMSACACPSYYLSHYNQNNSMPLCHASGNYRIELAIIEPGIGSEGYR